MIEWRTKAVSWIRGKANEQQAINDAYPQHVKCYPSWVEKVRNLNWLADELEREIDFPPESKGSPQTTAGVSTQVPVAHEMEAQRALTDNAVRSEYLEWLKSLYPARNGVGGNEAWNAGVAWANARSNNKPVQNPEECPNCDGTGMMDSGGIMPWGDPANIPCGGTCKKQPSQAEEPNRCIKDEGLQVMDRKQMRDEWRANGGEIHGPRVETVTMTEEKYFDFRSSLEKRVGGNNGKDTSEQQESRISTAHGPWIESNHPGEEGETHCERCLLRIKFLGARGCTPHIVPVKANSSVEVSSKVKTFTDEQLTEIYNSANSIPKGKAPPITTQKIFTAMRAMISHTKEENP